MLSTMYFYTPRRRLAVRERKWGKTGYNKVPSPGLSPAPPPRDTGEKLPESEPPPSAQKTSSSTNRDTEPSAQVCQWWGSAWVVGLNQ